MSSRNSWISRAASVGMIAVLAGGMSVMSGCLVSSSSHTRFSGSYVGPATYEQIKVGETKKEWVLAVMGTPTSTVALEDGTEVWKWAYEKKRRSSGGVFLLAGGSSSTETVGATYVEMKDGIVQKAWQD